MNSPRAPVRLPCLPTPAPDSPANATVAGPPDPGTGCVRLGHARPLDGLRGVAVLAVMLHNCGAPGFQGGFLGVDIFFALSGFLITTLLLEDHVRRGTIALAAFFWRRVLRLYPALVVLIAAVALSSLARPEVDASRVWLVVVSNLFYFSNWVLAADTRAWAGGTAHTWSLAVEVHFYVGWALLLAFGTRRWGPGSRRLLGWAAGIAVASALWRIVVWDGGAGVARAYTSTDTRCDALFLGAAAALLRWQWLNRPGQAGGPPLSRPVVWGLELAAATVIVWWIATTADKAPAAFLGGFGLVGGMSAVLILTTLLSPHSLLAAPLSLGVLVWFGHISYSLYLWHLPVAKLLPVERLARHGLSGWMATAVCVLLSTAIAAASYYGIERTFQRLREKARA